MSNIDYKDLDGASAVSRKSAGVGKKVGIAVIAMVMAGGLAWVNMPSGPQNGENELRGNEDFETSQFSPRTLPEASNVQPKIEQIVVPEQVVVPPQQAADVNQVVEPGVDINEQRRLLEQQLREQEEARRREEEARLAEEQARLAEAERVRKEAEEKALWERLRSNQIVTDGSSAEDGAGQATVSVAPDGQLVSVPGSETDANRAFLAQSQTSSNAMATAIKNQRTDALIAEGTLIRGFLETAINTDLPGSVRAVVREDVYSLDGRRILIPKGARLVGEYKSGLSRGQTRVFVVWNRMIRSDGVSVALGSTGTDGLGRAGMTGRVDSHWVERYGSAIMLSLIGGAAEYLSAMGDNNTNEGNTTVSTVDPITGAVTTVTTQPARSRSEARQIASDRASNSLNSIAQEAFKDSASIPPTVHIDQGTQIVVFVRRDLDFSNLYANPVHEELARLKRGGSKRTAVDPVPLYMTPKDNWYPPTPNK